MKRDWEARDRGGGSAGGQGVKSTLGKRKPDVAEVLETGRRRPTHSGLCPWALGSATVPE